MSVPTIPPVTPSLQITGENAVSLLLASIAFEELGLSHILNSEAEKIQYVLGSLGGQTGSPPPTVDDLIRVNSSVNRMLKTVVKTQMLLQFKLEDTLHYHPENPGTLHVNTASVTAVYQKQSYRATDRAYYHTEGGAAK